MYGVTTENLADYTKAALKKLLTVFPDIDGIQFRMHWESGLTREETPPFWREVFAMLHEANPAIRFDLRAKGLPDEVIEDAIAQELAISRGNQVLDGAVRDAVSPDARQSAESTRSPSWLCRFVALSQAVRRALAHLERRNHSLSVVG